MPDRPAFHLAFPVRDLEETRRFYGGLLGCPVGREAATWIDFDLFGHQLSAHLAPGATGDCSSNPVDGRPVPVPHFGVVLDPAAWDALAARLRESGVEFVIEPTVRFQGAAGEQRTMFFRDPSGNALEFKTFPSPSALFRR